MGGERERGRGGGWDETRHGRRRSGKGTGKARHLRIAVQRVEQEQ